MSWILVRVPFSLSPAEGSASFSWTISSMSRSYEKGRDGSDGANHVSASFPTTGRSRRGTDLCEVEVSLGLEPLDGALEVVELLVERVHTLGVGPSSGTASPQSCRTRVCQIKSRKSAISNRPVLGPRLRAPPSRYSPPTAALPPPSPAPLLLPTEPPAAAGAPPETPPLRRAWAS